MWFLLDSEGCTRVPLVLKTNVAYYLRSELLVAVATNPVHRRSPKSRRGEEEEADCESTRSSKESRKEEELGPKSACWVVPYANQHVEVFFFLYTYILIFNSPIDTTHYLWYAQASLQARFRY